MKRGRLQRKDILGADLCLAIVAACARPGQWPDSRRARVPDIDAALALRLGRPVGVKLTAAKLLHLERYGLVVDVGDARYWGLTPRAAIMLGLGPGSPGVPDAPRWMWDDARAFSAVIS